MRIPFFLSSLKLSEEGRGIVEIENRLANDNHNTCLIIPGNVRDDEIKKEFVPTIKINESKLSGARQRACPILDLGSGAADRRFPDLADRPGSGPGGEESAVDGRGAVAGKGRGKVTFENLLYKIKSLLYNL